MKPLKSKEVYRCRIFHVTEEETRDDQGRARQGCVVHHAHSVAVLAVDDEGRALMVSQFRVPLGRTIWELVAGVVDEGESEESAAQRELAEETGFTARDLRRLASFYPTPGYVSEKITVFLATGLTAGEAKPEADEHLELRWWARDEIDAMLRDGRIEDGKTLIGLLAWRFTS